MIHRALPVAATLALVAGLAAGCSSQPAARRTAAAPATATIAPLATPTAETGEITRSLVSGASVVDPVGSVPSSGQLAVDVACSGRDGTTMAWSLVAGDGEPLGLSGTADCTGPPVTSWLGVTAGHRPAKVGVTLRPTAGVVSGYAIVRAGTP